MATTATAAADPKQETEPLAPMEPGAEAPEHPEEEEVPKTIQEQIDAIDNEQQGILEAVFDRCHALAGKEYLDPSDFSSFFHQFVKFHNEQDRLMERADAAKLDEMVTEFGYTIEDISVAWHDLIAEQLGKDCTRYMVKFTEKDGKVEVEVIPVMEAFPEVLVVSDDPAPPDGQASFI